MKHLSLTKILPHIGGTMVTGSTAIIIKKVVTKAKKIKDNTLYFHFDNEKTDWQRNVFNQSTVIVTDKPGSIRSSAGDATVVKVNDVYRAYWSFISYYRGLFDIPVVGITGTCGKTTTSEMIKAILSTKYKVISNYDGNNAWYLSLPYLLSINSSTKAAAFEMGVGKPGDIKYMCKHYRPQVGVLLNIGTYHLLGCKTQENYIKAKAELLEGLGFTGTLILNADEENTKKINLTPYKGKIIYFGVKNSAQFKGTKIKYVGKGMEFTLHHKTGNYQVYVPGLGEHNVYNALAAIAACYSLGIDISKAIQRLAVFRHVRKHMEISTGVNGCTIIDDTWNCTPLSMESGLSVLNHMRQSKKSIAVMGYMPQLGEAGKKEYDRIGKKVAQLNVDYLVLIGEEPRQIGISAINFGFDKSKVFYCSSADQLYNVLLPLTGPDVVILFKFPYKFRLSKDPTYIEFMNKIFNNTIKSDI